VILQEARCDWHGIDALMANVKARMTKDEGRANLRIPENLSSLFSMLRISSFLRH
jgi:hypothetical protein